HRTHPPTSTLFPYTTLFRSIAGMKWRIQPKNGRALAEIPNGAERIALLADNLDAPNSDDSFRSFAEQVLEDIIVGGFGAVELQRSEEHTSELQSQSNLVCRL